MTLPNANWLKIMKIKGKNYFSGDRSSFWDSLTRSLLKGFQGLDLLCILVSASFGTNNFRSTQGLELFFSKCLNFNVHSAIKTSIHFFNFQKIAFELVAVTCPYFYENTGSWQSKSWQLILKSHIWLKMMHPKSSWLKKMKKWDKSTFLQILVVFGNG